MHRRFVIPSSTYPGYYTILYYTILSIRFLILQVPSPLMLCITISSRLEYLFDERPFGYFE